MLLACGPLLRYPVRCMGPHVIKSSPSGLFSLAAPAAARLVLVALRRIVRALRLSAGEAEREGGISGAQLFLLQRLAERPARSIAELAERTLTDPSSVSVVVSRLALKGLVARAQSTADARKSELKLTARGRALLRKAPRPAQARLIEALGALPGMERRNLAHALSRLAEAMGAGEQPAALFFEDEDKPAPKKSPRARRTAPSARSISSGAALTR